jgi:hypothetical protein
LITLMFETVIAAMLKHKQGIFAAIAVTALVGGVLPPAVQVAQAQGVDGGELAQSVLDSVFGGGDDDEAAEADDDGGDDSSTTGDDNQRIDQTADQENDQEQDQDAEQEVEQNNDQSETNIQANELDTGANTATVAQSNDADQDVAAAAEASDADAESEAEDEDHGDHHGKDKKHHHSDGSDSDTTTSSAEAIVSATAEATGIVDQDNDATVRQDSSIHDVDLSNNVNFGDDTNEQVAIPIIDQDQDQRAANLAVQAAANLDLDEINYGTYSLVTDIDEDDDGGFCPPGQEGRDNPRFPGCN